MSTLLSGKHRIARTLTQYIFFLPGISLLKVDFPLIEVKPGRGLI